MSTPTITRRTALTGTLAAAGAIAAPAGTIAADPEERLRAAVQEMEAVVRARWPERDVRVYNDISQGKDGCPVFMIACLRTGRARS
jgi:hypothetical protein